MRVPSYRKHKATGGAWIETNGRLTYLGTYGTDAARARYFDELAKWAESKGTSEAATAYLAELARWADQAAAPGAKQKYLDELARLSAGEKPAPTAATFPAAAPGEPLLIKHLILDYWRRRVTEHYQKRGKLTSEARNIRTSLKFLRRLYGNLPASAFDEQRLERYRDTLIDDRGNSVKTINTRVRQVRYMFRWAARKKLVPSAVWADLCTLENLTPGRTRAKPGKRVPPVPEEVIDQTLPFLPPIVADIVRFVRATGCRPSEPLELRPRDIVRHPEVDVWYFRPEGHKSEHRGTERRVYIGPKAQAILRPYLSRNSDANCFAHSADDADAGRPYTQQGVARCLKRALCKLAKSLGHQLPKRPKKSSPSWTPKREWFESVGAPYWHLHQLRHTAADEADNAFDIDGARVVLGHTDARTTEKYLNKAAKDQRDFEKAAEVARQIG